MIIEWSLIIQEPINNIDIQKIGTLNFTYDPNLVKQIKENTDQKSALSPNSKGLKTPNNNQTANLLNEDYSAFRCKYPM